MDAPRRILFSGYAPVHFVCFLPVYEILRREGGVELWLSGGFASEDEPAVRSFEIEGFYDPFPVERDRIVPFSQASTMAFDVAVCAHTSATLLPRNARRTVQIFHGVSFKNFAVRERVLTYDLLCLPGRYHAERFRQRGLVRPGGARCLVTGFPKADRLVAPGFDRAGFLARHALDPSRPSVLYAPTGGKNNSLETVGEAVIAAFAADGRYNLLVKPHDHPKRAIDWFARLGGLESDRVRLVRDVDVVDYLRAADLLLTDASSVAVEYTLLDRPMVFIDVPDLLANALRRGAPLDLETHGRRIGQTVLRAEEVLPAVARGLAQPHAEAELRRATARHVFHAPGGAAARVAHVIRWAADLVPDLPRDVETLVA
jgi:hypothetical protein